MLDDTKMAEAMAAVQPAIDELVVLAMEEFPSVSEEKARTVLQDVWETAIRSGDPLDALTLTCEMVKRLTAPT